MPRCVAAHVYEWRWHRCAPDETFEQSTAAACDPKKIITLMFSHIGNSLAPRACSRDALQYLAQCLDVAEAQDRCVCGIGGRARSGRCARQV